MKIRRKSLGQVIVFGEKSKGFGSCDFSPRTLWRILSGKTRSREETVVIFGCASLFKQPIATYSSTWKKGLSF